MATQPAPVPSPKQRSIRVFVSSTFRDMQAERDELVKRTFPALRRLCERRGVSWSEVDLRWGVPSEEAAEGKVLPVCLAEIHRCRPYFIGLLGERYGWVPMELATEMIEREPWLAEHRDKSVTELEILHGVLNDPEMASRSLFYFRDPAFAESLPRGQQADFREVPTADEIAALGREGAEQRAEARRQKLAALKERIRQRHSEGKLRFAPREDYRDPRTLGDLVLDDFTRLIDEIFPEQQVPDPLDREAGEHEAFAESRREVYVARQTDLQRLDSHADGDGPPLAVLGEAGVGKTALLANWAASYRERHPDVLLLQHFVGATPYSTDWAGMVRRILGELNRRFDLKLEIPDKAQELRLAFANGLYRAAAKGRVVLVLDGLNQLEDRDQAPDLVWLPPEVPPQVRLIVSTLPGRPLAALRERGWPTTIVKALEPGERRALIDRYVREKHGGHLSSRQVERIAMAPQASNPLYLRTLLDELRVFGIHEQLDERIGHYLGAPTVPELYVRVLARWEEDYERERPGLVREAMSLLWAARRGLSESELLDLLGAGGQRLPQAHWSPLYMAAWDALVARSGLLGFFHDDLRKAVQARYLEREESKAQEHQKLARYFEKQRLDPRAVDELPWQLAQAKAWRPLYQLLADLEFFDRAWVTSEFEVKSYWASIEANSDLRLVEAYRSVVEKPAKHHADRMGKLGILFFYSGHPEETSRVWRHLEGRFRQLGDHAGLSTSLGNQALILHVKGDLDGAMAQLKEQERICCQLGDLAGLQSCLCNQAVILWARGDLDTAMALFKEAERICRQLDAPTGLQACLGNQAVILRERGNLDGAMTLSKEAERICRQLGYPTGLQSCLCNQALILRERGDRDGAMTLFKEGERICRQLGDPAGLEVCFRGQALILQVKGDLDGAMELLKEAQRICRQLGDPARLQVCLRNQAGILQDKGDLDGAMALLKEAERICRQLGNLAELQACLGDQAGIHMARGDLEAWVLLKEAERICRQLGNLAGLQACLGNQAGFLLVTGNPDGAMVLLKEVERICRQLGDPAGLSRCFGIQAVILRDRGDLDGAIALHKEEERISRQLGDHAGLFTSLGNQAVILRAKGDLNGAIVLLKQTERLCRQLENPEGLATCLANQAVILAKNLGRLAEAFPLAEEAFGLAEQHGLVALASRIQAILDFLRSKREERG